MIDDYLRFLDADQTEFDAIHVAEARQNLQRFLLEANSMCQPIESLQDVTARLTVYQQQIAEWRRNFDELLGMARTFDRLCKTDHFKELAPEAAKFYQKVTTEAGALDTASTYLMIVVSALASMQPELPVKH